MPKDVVTALVLVTDTMREIERVRSVRVVETVLQEKVPGLIDTVVVDDTAVVVAENEG